MCIYDVNNNKSFPQTPNRQRTHRRPSTQQPSQSGRKKTMLQQPNKPCREYTYGRSLKWKRTVGTELGQWEPRRHAPTQRDILPTDTTITSPNGRESVESHEQTQSRQQSERDEDDSGGDAMMSLRIGRSHSAFHSHMHMCYASFYTHM